MVPRNSETGPKQIPVPFLKALIVYVIFFVCVCVFLCCFTLIEIAYVRKERNVASKKHFERFDV